MTPPTHDTPAGRDAYPNPIIESIMTTRAMRRYSDEPVERADIEWCLRAAQQAPSGGNIQPQHYLVLTDPEPKRVLGEWYQRSFDRYEAASPDPQLPDGAAKDSYRRTKAAARHLADHIAQTPVVVMFLMANLPWGLQDDDGPIDIGRLDASVYPAVQNFCIAARSLGLGTALTTVMRVYGAEALDELGVPADAFEIAAVVPVGYPTGRFGVARRRDVASVTHWNAFS